MDVRPPGISHESWLASGGRPSGAGEPLNVPPVLASNFLLGDGSDHSYARGDSTTTWTALEGLLGGLESATALAFASGMAAIAAVFELLPTGANLAIPADCYQGVAGVVADGATAGRWSAERIETDDTAGWIAAATRADLLWIETPSNPLLLVADLRAIGAADRRPGSLLVVDNTFATPVNQQPLDAGADIAVQSTTKFIGGHSDLLGGVATTRDPVLAARLDRVRTLHGATPGALESFLALRGARTLALRLERSQRSAGVLARRLSEHRAVEHVRYPGLPTDPGHPVAAEQLGGFGSIVSFEVVGGGEAADAVCRRTRLIHHATSLGGVESTMERRSVIAGQEHLPPGLVRLSVGIEHVDDLWADLDQALGTG